MQQASDAPTGWVTRKARGGLKCAGAGSRTLRCNSGSRLPAPGSRVYPSPTISSTSSSPTSTSRGFDPLAGPRMPACSS